jgi:hypothetical protein
MKCKLRCRVDDLSINIELELIPRSVSDAYRPRSSISAQVFQFTFYRRLIAVERIQILNLG